MKSEDLLKLLSARLRILEERSVLLGSIVATFKINMRLYEEGKVGTKEPGPSDMATWMTPSLDELRKQVIARMKAMSPEEFEREYLGK